MGGLEYAAALIGEGSEVLGFDDDMSTDHAWAPRVQIFLNQPEEDLCGAMLQDLFRRELPEWFRGHQVEVPIAEDMSSHLVRTHSPRDYLLEYLGFDIERGAEPADWLTFPEQKLRTIAEAAVYRDGIGLANILARFNYYPRDVWLYLLASGWNRIGQEEHLMGRAGMVGDEIGSAIIGARLVRDLMRLCFLMERTYAPYAKWFGTAFSQLECSRELGPHLRGALAAPAWREREHHLCRAYEFVAGMHNALGLTDPLPEECAPFFTRPFRVIHLHGNFAGAIVEKIEDPGVRQIAANRLIGSIDQWSDSTDILSDPVWRDRFRSLYA